MKMTELELALRHSFFQLSKKPMISSVRDLLMLSKITYNVIIKSNKMKFKQLKIVG